MPKPQPRNRKIMSSHHSQSLSDPNYLTRLQNLRIGDDSSAAGIQVSHRRTSSLNGANENDIGSTNINRMPTIDDYKLYDQNKFITASKLTGPPSKTATFRSNTSPTHSISSQSLYENIYNPSITQQPLPPPPPNAFSHYSTVANRSSLAGGTYEVIGKKYEPTTFANGTLLGRFAHTPQPDDTNDPSHIYENLANVSGMFVYNFQLFLPLLFFSKK